MRFFTRLTLVYALIVLVLTGVYYYLSIHYHTGENEKSILGGMIVYIVLIFGSALFISAKDEYNGYAGLNYHLTTYIIVNGIPLLLVLFGIFDRIELVVVLGTMIFWGIGLLFHWGMYFFIFRKRNIGRYEKEDVFK